MKRGLVVSTYGAATSVDAGSEITGLAQRMGRAAKAPAALLGLTLAVHGGCSQTKAVEVWHEGRNDPDSSCSPAAPSQSGPPPTPNDRLPTEIRKRRSGRWPWRRPRCGGGKRPRDGEGARRAWRALPHGLLRAHSHARRWRSASPVAGLIAARAVAPPRLPIAGGAVLTRAQSPSAGRCFRRGIPNPSRSQVNRRFRNAPGVERGRDRRAASQGLHWLLPQSSADPRTPRLIPRIGVNAE